MTTSILRADEAPPFPLQSPDYVGLVELPGTGRLVWWTGKVAVGLRYQAQAANSDQGIYADKLQRQLLRAA